MLDASVAENPCEKESIHLGAVLCLWWNVQKNLGVQ